MSPVAHTLSFQDILMDSLFLLKSKPNIIWVSQNEKKKHLPQCIVTQHLLELAQGKSRNLIFLQLCES